MTAAVPSAAAPQDVTRDEPQSAATSTTDELREANVRRSDARPEGASRDTDTLSRAALAKQPIAAAQRQWAYRQRSKRAVTQAIGAEAKASRVTLLALLAGDLALLSDETAKSRHSAARNTARRVINELVTRYGIELTDRT